MSLIEYQSDQCLGIRTRARIAKGVKEDRKKTKPGKIKKGKKYNSESDLWYDRFRVKSSLGGQSSNSLSASQAKPKIFRHFRKLKRKKLYCPIKHCVRIQIPRKGYFYRSTVRFKAPGSAPSVQRLEFSTGSKSRSKVQIPRLAPTSPQSPNLLKKRLNRQREVPKPAPHSLPLPAPLEHLDCALDSEVLMCNPDHKTSNTCPRRGPGQISATLETPVIPTSRKGKVQAKRKSKGMSKQQQRLARGAEDVAEVSGTSSERIISISKNEIRTPPPSETSFDTLLSCLSRILGKDEGLCDLEISPVRTGAGESSFDSDFQMLKNSSSPPNIEMTEMVAAFDNCYATRESDAIYASPAASLTLRNFEGQRSYGLSSEDSIAKALIGEIDLHLELENYLHAIDGLSGAKNRTKNTLQCNLYEDSNRDLQNRTEEFFDATENKSNSTFTSATSVCTQQDGDTNQMHVFLDRKHDMTSVSEEHFDSRNTKLFISQTQFKDKLGDTRKIKSDNDPKKIQQEGKLKSSIRRTMGKTSFRSDEKMWMLLPPLIGQLWLDSSADSYEKILPFHSHSNKSCDDINRSNLLYSNSVYSMSVESFSTSMRKSASESDWKRTVPTRMSKSEERLELLLPEETSSSNLLMRTIPEVGSNVQIWSPSLQELIEIYNSVLKKNKKIRSNSRTSVSRCVSSHLFSFLNEELKEKECKANLLMLSRKLNKRLKIPEMWKPGKQKKDDTLVQYVTMFQEILKSSMSISQIALLNSITSGLQGYFDRNSSFVENLKGIKKKREKITRRGERGKVEGKPVPLPCTPRNPTEKRPTEKVVTTVKPPSVRSAESPKKPQVAKPKSEETVAMEEITKIDLASPTELESILQSCFVTEGADGKRSRDANDKILVTVKLCGNHIFVSKLSYFKNETALTPGGPEQSGTSELIIENVTRDQVKNQLKDVRYKKTRSSKLREIRNHCGPVKPKTETKAKPCERLKRVKKYSRPSTSTPKAVAVAAAAAAAVEKELRKTYTDKNRFLPNEIDQQISLPFEYDQMQLRAQHPIECIIESSESRISGDIESSCDDLSSRKTDPPSEKKVPPKDQASTKKAALDETLTENVYSKDLCCGFDWHDSRFDKSLSRTKSHVISRKADKSQSLTKKDPKQADTVRSLNDLKRKPKCRKNVRRKFGSYLCYPSILNLQEKQPAAAVKKNSKKRLRQKNRSLRSSNSRITSNCTLQPRRSAGGTQSSKPGTSDKETPHASHETAEEEDMEKLTRESSANSIKLTNSEMLPNMELLYDNEIPSTSITPKMSASVVKQNLKTASSDHLSVEGKDSQVSGIAAEDAKESSTVIHFPKSDCDDMSFPSLMVHSDSFLKYYSSLPLTPENLNLLLKSSSDRKFYPGRVTSSDKQQNPFVKFMLTPTQNADGGLPPHQVQVVDRKHAAAAAVVDCSNGNPTTASEDVDEKISLPSIEKFIKKLSRSKTKDKPKSKTEKPKPEENKETPSSVFKRSQKKCSTLAEKSRSRATDRKPYHECQKRRLSDKTKAAEKRAKPTEKKLIKEADSSDKKSKEKVVHKPESSEINFLSLKNFVVTLTQMMESYQNLSRENARNQAVTIPREEPKVAEADCKTEGTEAEGHMEKGTNTIPEKKCSLTRMSDVVTGNALVRAPQAVKSAVTQTDDSLETKNRTEKEYERADERRKANCLPETPPGSPPVRKAKTLKIKIHCDSNNNNGCRDSSKTEEVAMEAMYSVSGNRKPQQLDEKGLLDSLVMEEPEVAILERRNSAYFDTSEKHSESENCRTEWGRDDDQQEFLAYWSTVDPVRLSARLVLEKESDRNLYSISPDKFAELVCDEILKSLQAGKICRSLTLLEKFLEKAESSPSWSPNSDRLRKVLLLVNRESKNLMLGLERNAWLKVFFLLEDLSRTFGSEDVNAKGFLEKIRGLDDRRLLDLRSSYFSLSQRSLTGNSRFKNVFCRITDSLRCLKNSIYTKRRCCSERRSQEERTMDRYSIRSVPDRPETSPLQQLRKQIQQQKAYIEFLLGADCGYVPEKVQDVKRKVLEKLRTFDRLLSTATEGCSLTEKPRER